MNLRVLSLNIVNESYKMYKKRTLLRSCEDINNCASITKTLY